MKRTTLSITISLVLIRFAAADPALRDGTVARFASVSEGAEILGRKDDFIQRLSVFDRSARIKTDKPISEQEFLKFVQANVVEWTEEEKRMIEAAITQIRPALEALPLSLPKLIYFIKTTGAEEGKAFYTRDTAIILPQSQLGAAAPLLEKTIVHELFHILSRGNPALREQLYEMIGFTRCPEIDFSAELKSRKITNPDAPRNDHFIHVQVAGREVLAVPILFSDTERYDANRGGEFFNYLQFKFLVVGKNENSSPKRAENDSHLVAPEEVSGFFEKVGRNTTYVIHPEEILADNFALLIIGEQGLASSELVEKMRMILTQK